MPDETPKSDLFQDVNREDREYKLDPDCRIYRYMRLPAFLMLLSGKVFIPTLETLRKSDPLESRLPYLCYPSFSVHFSPLLGVDAAEWLEKRMPKWQMDFIELNRGKYFGPSQFDSTERFYVEAWLDQLARRRCIWCWYANNNQSMAQWKVYGPSGVAIRSAPRLIRSAFEETTPPDKTSAGRVHYEGSIPMSLPETLVDPEWIMRPYYFKEKAYEHEKEVRFVMAVNPGLCDLSRGGTVFDLDPAKLIQEIIISPEIYGSEAIALKKTLRKEFSILKSIDINISPLLSPDLQSEESVAERIARQMDRPFDELDKDYDQTGKPVPLQAALFGDV
jgi:hypothetical protein